MEHSDDLILTCDAGTSGCKCAVFNCAGEALLSVRRDYPTSFPRPNWAEQDPDAICAAVFDGIREVLAHIDARRIACVALSGTMNGCIPVDAQGNALHPNIIHSDSRTNDQVEQILRVIPFDAFYRLTGNRADTHYTLPKMLWIREHLPDVDRQTRWYLNIKDYLYGRLTGRFGCTDYSDASLMAALDIHKRVWAEDLLRSLGLDVHRMPAILHGHNVEGMITRQAHQLTGLAEGTPVAIGGGDGACTTRGAGVSRPGSAYCYIGSSAWVAQLLDRPILDPRARMFNWVDMNGEDYHVCGTVQCAAAAFDWCRANLLGAGGGAEDIASVEDMARQIAPGAEGVLFLPTLMGWRTPYWDPNTRGCLLGFSLYHDRRHIARAVYEGIAFALNSCAQVMTECGAPLNELTLTGGGARSGLWPDILASVFGIPTRVHRFPGETTSLGAAIAACVGMGIFRDYTDAAAMTACSSVHEPDARWQSAYAEVYPIFADIYERIRPLNERIVRLGGGAPAGDAR